MEQEMLYYKFQGCFYPENVLIFHNPVGIMHKTHGRLQLVGIFLRVNNKEGALIEEEIAELLKKENEEFKKLTEEHRTLEELLAKIDRKRYLTPEEEFERKKIQKKKLLKKDRMAALVREYKKAHYN
jgi:uncharacterized protein YdcH (DUF465 family)